MNSGRDYERYIEANRARDDFALCELVLMELYVLLRSPAVLPRPLAPRAALDLIRRFRAHPRWAVIDYPGNLMESVWKRAGAGQFPALGDFRCTLAVTLLHHGVEEFATRNTKHFRQFGFPRLINPIDQSVGT
ncbi:MAG: VapC toxin family PIN domain ribonuclease [Acidobacteriia bacterium]|nr:VapC toxin family PIN domain ribonuclease [Terriglobia bacterium]